MPHQCIRCRVILRPAKWIAYWTRIKEDANALMRWINLKELGLERHVYLFVCIRPYLSTRFTCSEYTGQTSRRPIALLIACIHRLTQPAIKHVKHSRLYISKYSGVFRMCEKRGPRGSGYGSPQCGPGAKPRYGVWGWSPQKLTLFC